MRIEGGGNERACLVQSGLIFFLFPFFFPFLCFAGYGVWCIVVLVLLGFFCFVFFYIKRCVFLLDCFLPPPPPLVISHSLVFLLFFCYLGGFLGRAQE